MIGISSKAIFLAICLMIIGAIVLYSIQAVVDKDFVYFVTSMIIFIYCETSVLLFWAGKKKFLKQHNAVFPALDGVVYAITGIGGFLFLILAIAIYLFKLG